MSNAAELSEKAKIAVMAYKASECTKIAKEAVSDKTCDLVTVINGFTDGITAVGDLFGQKKLFLPHIMAAAKAMQAGMDIIAPELEKRGGKVDNKYGTVVICTIEGDIHSIGKDIVAIMLKVAGFTVQNIGRDVKLSTILSEVKRYDARFVGTSALMTSTMINQKTFEDMMTNEGLKGKCLTNVGGAPVTQQWADEISADIYSENANDCVAKFLAVVGNA